MLFKDWIFVNLKNNNESFEEYLKPLIKQLAGINLDYFEPVANIDTNRSPPSSNSKIYPPRTHKLLFVDSFLKVGTLCLVKTIPEGLCGIYSNLNNLDIMNNLLCPPYSQCFDFIGEQNNIDFRIVIAGRFFFSLPILYFVGWKIRKTELKIENTPEFIFIIT